MKEEKYQGSERHIKNACEAAKKGRKIFELKAQKRREEYYKNPKLCKNCGKPIDYYKRLNGIFCSHSCSASVSNKNREITEKHKLKISKALRGKTSPLKGSTVSGLLIEKISTKCKK